MNKPGKTGVRTEAGETGRIASEAELLWEEQILRPALEKSPELR
jgi:hypothetical protein